MANASNRFEEFRVSPPETETSAPIRKNRFQEFAPVPTKPQDPVEAFNALPWWQQGLQAADDTVRLMANGMTFGQMDKLAGYLSGDGTEAERAKSADAKARAGSAGVASELVGSGMAGALLPGLGSGYLGSMGTGALYGGIDGGLRDAETWGDRAQNVALGAGAGGTLGLIGHGAADALSAGAGWLGRAWRYSGLAPDERAAAQIANLGDSRYGGFNAMTMDRDIAKLGDEAARVDVLGERGRAVARKAANVSPEAREGLETFALGRKSGQNDRLAGDIQKAARVPVGSQKSVEAMKREAYEAVRPQIHQAYDTARAAGADVPLDDFADILSTPAGSSAFNTAFDNVATRAVTDGVSDGNLAVLDEVQRIFSKRAAQGYRDGDPQADVYAALARTMKERLDNFLAAGDEYATARAMRAKAYRADEAFDAGEALGRRSVPFDALAAGRKVTPEHAGNMATAYAQTKSQRLANLPSTEGALNEFVSKGGKDASKVALGDRGAETLADAVFREKTFNLLPKALGNSTTARQADEMGSSALDALAGGLAASGNLGLGGLVAVGGRLARGAGLSALKNAVTRRARESAPALSDALTGRGVLSAGRFYDPSMLERLGAGIDPSLAARVLLGAGFGGMEAQRDTLAAEFR